MKMVTWTSPSILSSVVLSVRRVPTVYTGAKEVGTGQLYMYL